MVGLWGKTTLDPYLLLADPPRPERENLLNTKHVDVHSVDPMRAPPPQWDDNPGESRSLQLPPEASK